MTHVISSNATEPLPGDFARGVFIFAELIMFGALSSVYAFARSSHLALFDTAQLTLNRNDGYANTLILLTSSYFVVRAT
ncbi:MAG: hypothetical protein PF483_11875 [Halothiobacillus sp.]|jgi:nitric oxide reductase NorE protein|nr:hypothetical protein [Halothiobacillus sp.]